MIIDFAWSCYREIVNAPLSKVQEIGETILLPRFPCFLVEKIIRETQAILMNEAPIVKLESNLVVVGDIHGNIFDLFRIFSKNGYPPNMRYLFLGDYVDRGEFSVDVIIFLFILKARFPQHITLLRGNHEFKDVNANYGFLNEVCNIYENDLLWKSFNEAFEYLPLVAIIDNQIVCIHGGISERTTCNFIMSLHSFPVEHTHALDDLVWSDPSDTILTINENIRGKGVRFGIMTLTHFLDSLGCNLLIRAHECVDGFRYNLDDKVLTVFSTSNYGSNNNSCGYCKIDSELNVECDLFTPMKKPTGPEDLNYYNATYNEKPSNQQFIYTQLFHAATKSLLERQHRSTPYKQREHTVIVRGMRLVRPVSKCLAPQRSCSRSLNF